MDHVDTTPGPESTIGERLEWAREKRRMQRPDLIRAVMTWSRRTAYSNILKNNIPNSKYYPALCRVLKIRQSWLTTGEGDWDASGDSVPVEVLRIDAELLSLCYTTAHSFISRFDRKISVSQIELFTMTARLYEEAVKQPETSRTGQDLEKILFGYFTAAMNAQRA
mgnify:FL=1